MKPVKALFHKEFRQHGVFAPAMICMCLLFQTAYCEWCYFFNLTIESQTYFSLAIVLTALYAGAAAALAYSTEHAENTYIFLRKMPISPTTIALGKTGWVVCGTLLVLLGNLILALIWTGGYLDGEIAFAFGFGIVEALVWGLFWSTRCKNQVHALLAGYLCAAGTLAILGNVFQESNTSIADAYWIIMPYRIIAILLVGCLAVRGMRRWFEYETKPSFFSRLFPEKITLRYPRKIQSPFFALVHQHIRHASLIYLVGVLCFIVWSLVYSYIWMVTAIEGEGSSKLRFMQSWECSCGIAVCAAGMALFWATIFGHDQKNDSYRFLSRLGIHEGKVWWSRMLPALLLYSPVLICYLGSTLTMTWKSAAWTPFYVGHWYNFWWMVLPGALAVWLTPAAVGAFVSISLRSQMVAIALTAVGIGLPLFWMSCTTTFLGCSPLWTTLPLLLALLLGSRIRAAYWLRETFTWRSRIIPLVPLFGVMVVVLTAIPFVRVYSVPNVSWDQIETYFAKMDLPERPEPAKLNALLQYVKKNEGIPPEYRNAPPNWDSLQWYSPWDTKSTYEEYILLQYAEIRREYNRSLAAVLEMYRQSHLQHYTRPRFNLVWGYTPWERERADRLTRFYIIAALSQSGGLHDVNAKSLESSFFRLRQTTDFGHFSLPYLPQLYETFVLNRCRQRLQDVCVAMNLWYQEHGTLPESLNDLVGTYLDELPVHPFTRASVEFHVDSPSPFQINTSWYIGYNNTYVFILGSDTVEMPDGRIQVRLDHSNDTYRKLTQSGGTCTYLRLGETIIVIELAQENESPAGMGGGEMMMPGMGMGAMAL